MTKPMTPSEIIKLRTPIIPPEVFTVVNHLLAENWHPASKSAVFLVKSLISAVAEELGLSEEDVRRNTHYLDFEDSYRAHGWYVARESSYRDDFFRFSIL